MSDSASPIDELLESLRAALAARRRDATARLEQVEAALARYRHALEQQIAHEFAAEHQLRARPGSGPSVAQAAEQLHKALLELPELARLFARAEPQLELSNPISERVPKSSAATPPTSSSWPRLRAALASQKLVVIGALSRDRSESVPEGLGEHVEWIDTERDGVHALGNLPQRIRQGRVAALIILDRAVKHKHSEPALAAAREAHVPTAFAGQGGRASLERALTQLEGMLGER
jgi:hypothetical protein